MTTPALNVDEIEKMAKGLEDLADDIRNGKAIGFFGSILYADDKAYIFQGGLQDLEFLLSHALEVKKQIEYLSLMLEASEATKQ